MKQAFLPPATVPLLITGGPARAVKWVDSQETVNGTVREPTTPLH